MSTYIANKQIRTPQTDKATPNSEAKFHIIERGEALPEGVFEDATIKAWLKRGLIREQGRAQKTPKPVLTSEDPEIVPGKSRQDEAPEDAAKPAAKPAKGK